MSTLQSDELRRQVATKLVDAIQTAEGLAKASAENPEKGSGGVPPKIRWYQLLGFLGQTLDGVLRTMDMNEVKHRITTVEKILVALESRKNRSPNSEGPASR